MREGGRGQNKGKDAVDTKMCSSHSLIHRRPGRGKEGGREGGRAYLDPGMGTDHRIVQSHAVGHGHVVHEHALVNLNARSDLAIGAQDGGLDVDLKGRWEGGGEGREGREEGNHVYEVPCADLASAVRDGGLVDL